MAVSTKKKVVWTFDSANSIMRVDATTSVNATLEARFEFELAVYKNSDTHVESMKITNSKDGKENGSIITSIIDLERDIRTFKKFGVVIGDTYFRDLAHEIEKVYTNIAVGEITISQDDRYKELIEQVKEFVTGGNEYITEDFCYIPVNMFYELALDCGYNDYEMRTLRSQLAKDKYIHMVSGRYAILKRLKGKPERVMAFHMDRLETNTSTEQDVTVMPTEEATVKSGADE